MDYIDISPVINNKIAVYPGDIPFSQNILLDFKKGDNLFLSGITSTLHVGSHADAPNHYHKDGQDIESRELFYYMGKCQVITVNIERGKRIYPQDINNIEIISERILFRTNSFPDSETWNSNYNSLSPELINYLAEKKVFLVGIDTPSVDPFDSVYFESHNCIFNNNMAILEGLVLDKAQDGLYVLIALPLKITHGDASPVRAILLKNTDFLI